MSAVRIAPLADTIVARASPAGGAPRAILRLSGPRAAALWAALGGTPQAIRGAYPQRIFDGQAWLPALCLWMQAPRSYTGEDTLELHIPGAQPLVEALYRRLLELGARAAQPGEFTRRAFESGRIDLTRAEGVLALIEAQNAEEQCAALDLLRGGLAQQVEQWSERLLDLRALCEATLDFDSEDTARPAQAELEVAFERLEHNLGAQAQQQSTRAVQAGLPRIVLAGAASAGKSTLFNALLQREAALVDAAPGTTRDYLVEECVLGDRKALLIDTAGLTTGLQDASQQEAQARARALAAQAEWVLWVERSDRPSEEPPAEWAERSWRIWTQIDRPQAAALPPGALGISCVDGRGLEDLRQRLAAALASRATLARGEHHQRHTQALERAREAVRTAREGLRAQWPLELVAEELRSAQSALEELGGSVGEEALLDRIFARFCLGK